MNNDLQNSTIIMEQQTIEIDEITPQNLRRNETSRKDPAKIEFYFKSFFKRENTAIILMAIPVFLALFKYPTDKHWYEVWKDNEVSIAPNMFTMLYAIALYVAVIVRYDLPFLQKLKEIQSADNQNYVGWREITLIVLNLLFCSSFIGILTGWESMFGLFDGKVFVVFAIILSWLGIKQIAGYVWVGVFICSMFNMSKVSDAMGFSGVIYILCAFFGIAFQLIGHHQLLKSFKEDFFAAAPIIKAEGKYAVEETGRGVKKAAKAVKTAAKKTVEVAASAAAGVPKIN